MARFLTKVIYSCVLLTFMILIVFNSTKNGTPKQESLKRRSVNSNSYPEEGNATAFPTDAWSVYLPYLINPSTICDSFNTYNGTKVLVLVKSSTEHFHLRNHFRFKADVNKEFKDSVKTVFLLGKSASINREILQESQMYGDIVQGSFMDTYRNLTIKTIMGYRWLNEYCTNADFVVLKDEDYRFNLENLFQYLKSQEKKDSVFTGYLIKNGSSICRDPKHKWYLSMEDYPGKTFPPYFPGGANILSIAIARKLASNFHLVKIIFIEDVYVGLVAQKSGINLTHSKLIDIKNCSHYPKKIACLQFTDPEEVMTAWKTSVLYSVQKAKS